MRKIVFDDVVFCTGVQKVHGILHAEQGMVVFYDQSNGIIARWPEYITYDMYETEVDAYMYRKTNTILRRLHRNDKDVETFSEEDFDVLTEMDTLWPLVEEQKVREVPNLIRGGIAVLAGIVSAVVSLLLKFYYCLPVGALLILGGVFYIRRIEKYLNSNIVYDRKGNWIDLVTGESNLNGGMRIPLREEDKTTL